ncbi:MAG: sialate O-acetylesterase [Aureliella sp.]
MQITSYSKNLLFFTTLLVIAADSSQAQEDHLFILSGQSNMNGLKPEQTLLPLLYERFGVGHVVVVKDSHGGQSISRWDKAWTGEPDPSGAGPGDLYHQLIAKVKEATDGRQFQTVSFLWMQGEKDARLGNAEVYRESFQRVLAQLQEDLGRKNINVVLGRLSDFGNENPDYPDWMAMRKVLVDLASALQRGRWVNTDDLNDGLSRGGKPIKNDLHYSAEGYKIFGTRMAEKAIELIERFDLPYEIAPPADPPYFRVRYPASKTPGKLQYGVRYTVWFPPGVEQIRGVIVHQHGCGTGSCKSGLTGAHDLHWQALAQKHDSALLAASYEMPDGGNCALWCDPRNGSAEAFQRGLDDLGELSGHPELSEVPWALWGHSGGAYWAATMFCLYPERVAAAWMRSGSAALRPIPDRPDVEVVSLPKLPIDTPLMFNLGTREGVTATDGRFSKVWPSVKEMHLSLRNVGAFSGVAIDPLSEHECGEQRYLAIPWFDSCLSHRLPKKFGGAMGKMPVSQAWLAPLRGSRAVPAQEFEGDLGEAIWLPDETVAKRWMEFVSGEEVTDSTAPPEPTDVRVDDGLLSWTPRADLESGILQFVIQRNGRELARVPARPTNPRGRKVAQGLQYSDTPEIPLVKFEYQLKDSFDSAQDSITVSTINTVGLSSSPAEAVNH